MFDALVGFEGFKSKGKTKMKQKNHLVHHYFVILVHHAKLMQVF